MAENAPIRCTLVSPERPLFDGHAHRVVVPGVDGEIGILPRHAPMIGALGPGLVRIQRGEEEGAGVERYAVGGGFLHVKKDVVTLLVTDAVQAQEVDRAKLRQELDSTIEQLQHPPTKEQFEELLLRRRWIETRLKLVE